MKGSAITGPVGKEAADLWPVSPQILYPFLPNTRDMSNTLTAYIAYRLQLRRSYVESTNLKLGILQKINKRLSGFFFSHRSFVRIYAIRAWRIEAMWGRGIFGIQESLFQEIPGVHFECVLLPRK